MIQLFAKNINNQWVQLDLIETEPVKLNLAVASVEDPTISVSNYSQDFTIPGTGKNTQFFRGAFNVNATDFDATRKTKAYLTNDGILVAWGNIRLNSIESNLKDELYFYNIQFFGETSDFASSVGGRNLSDLNLSHLNHGLSYSTITNSWLPATGGSDPITNGAIRYPLADWGYLYTTSGVTQPTVPTVSIGGVKSFTSSSNALALNQMKPMIQAKQIWDAIFNEAGFSYSSSFLNSDLFKNLYVMVDSQPRYAMNISSDCTVQAPNINVAPNTEIKINFSNIIAGNPSAFNLNSDSFPMSVDSGVNFEINTSVSAGVFGDSGSSAGCSITLELNIFDETDNTIAWSDSQNLILDNTCIS